MDPQKLTKQKKYIYLDSCVIQAAGSNKRTKSEAMIKLLEDLAKEGYDLAISDISSYETLHGLWGKQAEKIAKLMSVYESKSVTRTVFVLASMLGGLYHDERYDFVDMGDKIIAASAFLDRGLILTENHRDFPHPFFINKKYFPVQYTDGHHISTLDIALYEPNHELINRGVGEKEKSKN